jgi:hypothetical protein
MIQMPQNLKQKWIDSLRSGEYKQAFKSLHDNYNCHCVLGVLDIITHYDLSERLIWDDWCEKYNIIDTKTGKPPHSIYISCAGLEEDITVFNDISRLSFDTFADLIETQIIGI